MAEVSKFAIGQRVEFVDKYNHMTPPSKGKIIGWDPDPRMSTKRKGECFVILPDNESVTIVREASELTLIEE